MIAPAGRADAGAFLTRLLRLDPAAVVRLRPIDEASVELWAMLPFGVLVMRTVAGTAGGQDQTVSASELLNGLSDPATAPLKRRDADWRWPLPPSKSDAVERLPAAEIARVAAAAARTLREAAAEGIGGRAVGERALRDALLDHVPIVISEPFEAPIRVPQRLVQGLVRMGFLGPGAATSGDAIVTVRVAGSWVGLSGAYGSAWYRHALSLRLI